MAAPPQPFEWTPGQGFDSAALDRMAHTLLRPAEPMGEAWFMGEQRRLFSELQGDLGEVPVDLLQRALAEIASGTHAFGPRAEWRDWFHYLLPRLIPRAHETYADALLEVMITAFITQHPRGLDDEPYPGFRTDALGTLGRSLMDGVCWPGGKLAPYACLNKCQTALGLWRWFDASGPFSASMFFCLKYLSAGELKNWMHSVFRIRAPEWRAQVMAWLIGAYGVMSGEISAPARFSASDYPAIDWDWSHVLSGHYLGDQDLACGEPVDFISAENRLEALRVTRQHFTEAVFLDWLESFSQSPTVEAELSGLPFWFNDLYMNGETGSPAPSGPG